MDHHLIHRLRTELEADVDEIDRESITLWLLCISAKKPLTLHHPRMGSIHFEGVAFAGSVIDVFDCYVGLAVEDRIELRLRSIEDATETVAPADRKPFIEAAAIALMAARNQMLGRARIVKGKLLGKSGAVELRAGPDRQAHIAGRLSDHEAWLKREEDRRMIVGKDAVRRLDTAIARLATAGYGDFTRAARKLSAVLQSPEFAPTCGELTRDVDIEAFLKLSGDQHENLGDPLPLPDDTVAEMGIVICLIDYLGASEAEIADDIIFNHYGTGASIETAWQQFVKKVVLPFRNDLIDHLSALGRLAAQSAPPVSNISINVHDSQGVAIQHGSPGAVQTVAQHIDAAAANPALEALATTLSSVAVAPAMRADLDAELDTIRAQLKKTTPNAVVLRESGQTLRALVESIAGNLATPYLVTLGAALWKHLV